MILEDFTFVPSVVIITGVFVMKNAYLSSQQSKISTNIYPKRELLTTLQKEYERANQRLF